MHTLKNVAEGLGNTVVVCRRYYVHPDVLDAYRDGTLLGSLARRHAGNIAAGLEPVEAAVLDVILKR